MPSTVIGVAGIPTVDESLIWPSMQDLNTRLRRVITSYQRNYKKEELKQQQKAKVCHNFLLQFFYLISFHFENCRLYLQRHPKKGYFSSCQR